MNLILNCLIFYVFSSSTTMSSNQQSNMTTKFTLIFVKKDDQILLGYKKRGFGVGKWNGFGGKVEENESILEGAVRELEEESKLKVHNGDMLYLGYVRYEHANSSQVDIVYLFIVTNTEGTPSETEEMSPKWFPIKEIPYKDMWIDSQYWLPIVLKRHGVMANFLLGDDRKIQTKTIDEIEVPENLTINP